MFLFLLRIKRNVLTAPQKARLSAVPCPAAYGKQLTECEGWPQLASKRGWERQGKWQSHHAVTHSSWAECVQPVFSILLWFSYTIIFIKGEEAGLRMIDCFTNLLSKLYPQFLWSCQLTWKHQNCFTSLHMPGCWPWAALVCPMDTNRHHQQSLFPHLLGYDKSFLEVYVPLLWI